MSGEEAREVVQLEGEGPPAREPAGGSRMAAGEEDSVSLESSPSETSLLAAYDSDVRQPTLAVLPCVGGRRLCIIGRGLAGLLQGSLVASYI